MELLQLTDFLSSKEDKEVLKLLCNYAEKKRNKILCIDLETTTYKPKQAEILQVSIINGLGEVVFSSYCKPVNATEWKNAEEVNGISPDSVKDCCSFLNYVEKIQQIIKDYDVIVTYNGHAFDIPILEDYGISFGDKKHYDVCAHYTQYHGEILKGSEKGVTYRMQKLEYCANEFQYMPGESQNLHNALCDTEATLYCFYCLLQKQCEQFSLKGGRN